MNTVELNKLSEDLYNLFFYLHKKIIDPNEIAKNFSIPPSHVKAIIYLRHNGTSSISEIAKNLTISRPNMTPIIDKLIAENMVKRCDDPNDRRIIKIELTDKAHEFIKEQKEKIKIDLEKKISSLNSEDLEALSEHVVGITDIILKIK
ncbi:MarR family winged helix-turn-helix transcriptional regulator [Marinisporobacter balticus]|uniref:DNA-binding MarR family transcriptional regulator n=1 Tax=Marinisporobacter balticus TaxID=2018667 RepID=A0A4R2K9Q3_9FIRM|nr:MarR family transcriptional regulator [Marinisporobacter balticus]TCO68872.1 DNA-binding MarR family transcriptional regulator [Marinisporobacter balticus]